MGEIFGLPGAEGRRAVKPLWRHVLGDVLRDERLDQERILTEVAATAGVSPQYLSEVERGRKEASSEVLGAVADALGLELADVVGRVAGRLAVRVPDHADAHAYRRGDEWRGATRLGPTVHGAPARPGGSVADAVLLVA